MASTGPRVITISDDEDPNPSDQKLSHRRSRITDWLDDIGRPDKVPGMAAAMNVIHRSAGNGRRLVSCDNDYAAESSSKPDHQCIDLPCGSQYSSSQQSKTGTKPGMPWGKRPLPKRLDDYDVMFSSDSDDYAGRKTKNSKHITHPTNKRKYSQRKCTTKTSYYESDSEDDLGLPAKSRSANHHYGTRLSSQRKITLNTETANCNTSDCEISFGLKEKSTRSSHHYGTRKASQYKKAKTLLSDDHTNGNRYSDKTVPVEDPRPELPEVVVLSDSDNMDHVNSASVASLENIDDLHSADSNNNDTSWIKDSKPCIFNYAARSDMYDDDFRSDDNIVKQTPPKKASPNKRSVRISLSTKKTKVINSEDDIDDISSKNMDDSPAQSRRWPTRNRRVKKTYSMYDYKDFKCSVKEKPRRSERKSIPVISEKKDITPKPMRTSVAIDCSDKRFTDPKSADYAYGEGDFVKGVSDSWNLVDKDAKLNSAKEKKAMSLVLEVFKTVIQPIYNDSVRSLAVKQFKLCKEAGETKAKPMTVPDDLIDRCMQYIDRSTNLLDRTSQPEKMSTVNGGIIEDQEEHNDLDEPVSQEKSPEGNTLPNRNNIGGGYQPKYKLFSGGKARPLSLAEPDGKNNSNQQVQIATKKGKVLSSLAPVHMKDTPKYDICDGFFHTYINIPADDVVRMTHIPHQDDVNDLNFVRNMKAVYREGIHGSDEGCALHMGMYKLYLLLKIVIPKWMKLHGSKIDGKPALRYIYMALFKHFPNFFSYHNIKKMDILKDLTSRFEVVNFSLKFRKEVNFSPHFFCTMNRPSCHDGGCNRPMLPADDVLPINLNKILNAYLANEKDNSIAICKHDQTHANYFAGNRRIPLLPLKQRRKNFLNVRTEIDNMIVPTKCDHDGECGAVGCKCFTSNGVCTKSCGCGPNCVIRFPGCCCSPGQCRTAQCQCFLAKWECDPETCSSCNCDPDSPMSKDGKQLNLCCNVQVQRGAFVKLEIRKSIIDGAGNGCYCLEDVSKDQLVAEYTGEVISHDECERRGVVYDQFGLSYVFTLNDHYEVDSTRFGNRIRFANHSQSAANMYARIPIVRGEHRIGIYAKRDILAGEELFFDYGYKSTHMKFITKEVDKTVLQSMLDGLNKKNKKK